MKLNVFALVCLAASLVPASLGQDINIGSDGYSGIQIGGKDVTCPGNNFGDISNGTCTCADGSPCRTADDSESPEPAPTPATSATVMTLSGVALIAAAGLVL